VRVSSLAGVTTSATATLTIGRTILTPPPAQTTGTIHTTGFAIDLSLETGRTYRVQASSDLRTWTDVGTFSGASAAQRFVDAASRTAAQRFYRVISP
jgi:hypothetical protein